MQPLPRSPERPHREGRSWRRKIKEGKISAPILKKRPRLFAPNAVLTSGSCRLPARPPTLGIKQRLALWCQTPSEEARVSSPGSSTPPASPRSLKRENQRCQRRRKQQQLQRRPFAAAKKSEASALRGKNFFEHRQQNSRCAVGALAFLALSIRSRTFALLCIDGRCCAWCSQP